MSELKLFGKLIPLLMLNQDETLVHDCCETNLPSSSSDSLSAVNSNNGIQPHPPMGDQEKHEDDDNGGRSKKEEKTEADEAQEKSLKKPDKILPCPRCNSNESKFCYYNNYNVNQPRHFCKNCQRYWTAGGAMRNVPVGAGRRKTKSSSSAASALLFHHHVMISEAILGGQASAVLTFGNSSHLPLPPRPTLYRPSFPESFYSPPDSSPALGKHSRDEKESDKLENGASNSKALRIDDTDETAKSSMVEELMMKTNNTMNSGGMFDGFRSKTDDNRNYRLRTFSVLQANPAALSRSLNLHENT